MTTDNDQAAMAAADLCDAYYDGCNPHMARTDIADIIRAAYADRVALLERAVEACKMAKAAHESLFTQCLSNPIRNAWGEQVNLTEVNESGRLAGNVLADAASLHLAEQGRYASMGIGRTQE